MTALTTYGSIGLAWLALCLALCFYAWYGVRRLWALPLLAALAAYTVYVPTGAPRFTAPPVGHYQIVGAKIVVNEAIYVLLDNGGVPTYYVLPYTTQKASELQNALDAAAQNGGTASMVQGESGGETYDGEPPVQGESDKQAERPAVEVE